MQDRRWQAAQPGVTRYLPGGRWLAVVGHPRGETFVKIYKILLMITVNKYHHVLEISIPPL